MECGRPAERLQHQLQRLPQHDERIHSIIEQSANHQSVERELLAKQCQRDREQLELQRGHSAGRKVQRGGLYRKLQRNECTACELLSEWSHLPLVSEFVDLAMFRADKRLAAPCM